MKIPTALTAAALLALAAACTTVVEIPDDMPPNKLIQNAQEATDINKYKIALQYYGALLERYGDVGEYLATGEYEIAFIHYKQRKYAQARDEFESLLARYSVPDGEPLPSRFKLLTEKVLARMTERGH
jgi:outer membrane protein assembly factor BamD (BamD/ComL family)